MFYNFKINTFNFNVEVGGRMAISNAVTLRTLLDFSKSLSQAPGARFQSLHTTY